MGGPLNFIVVKTRPLLQTRARATTIWLIYGDPMHSIGAGKTQVCYRHARYTCVPVIDMTVLREGSTIDDHGAMELSRAVSFGSRDHPKFQKELSCGGLLRAREVTDSKRWIFPHSFQF